MTTQTPITDAIACANCNGELAKALLREMTPEALAHRLQHELARNAALVAALETIFAVDAERGSGADRATKMARIASEALRATLDAGLEIT